MTSGRQQVSTARSVTSSVLGLLAIPLLSVWAATVLGEAASSTDQSRLGWGLVALAVGVGSG